MLQEQDPIDPHLQDFKQVTYQQFFEHPLRSDNSRFYLQNKILRHSDKILLFFKQFDSYSHHSQTYILSQLYECLEVITTNGRLLALAKDNLNGKGLIEYVIAIVMRVEEGKVKGLLQRILDCVLRCHALPDQILKETLKELIVDFYGNKVNTNKLLTTAQVIQSVYQNKVQRPNEPNNPMLFHGETNNEVESNKNIGWVFGKGFTLAMWIWFEPITSKPTAGLGKLFTFYAEGVGGLEVYIVNEKLFYRSIGPRYQEPSEMISGVYMCSIEPHKWHFLAIQHQQPKTFSKSKVNVYLDKKLINSLSLDPPKPNPTCPTKIGFFNNLYCQTSAFCIYFTPIGIGRLDELSRNMNSIEYLKDPKALIFEERGGKIVQRSAFGWINSKLFRKNRKIQSQHMLPFFYLLRFISPSSGKPLNQLLALVISFLVLSKQHQQQAQKNNFFQMLGILICDLDYDASDQNTIKILNSIKQSITDQKLLDKFFSQLLWKLLSSKFSTQRKFEIFSIIKICFTQNLDHFSPIIGLDNILNFLTKYESRKIVCCEQHQILVGKLDKPFIENKEEKLLQYILQLVELLFIIPKLDMNIQLMKLLRLTIIKFSPCVQLSLIHLIRKIFIEKLNDKTTEDSFKKTLKALGTNKIHLLLLELISTTQFIDIKAETLKFLFSLISWKISPINEEEVAAYISQERFFKFSMKKEIVGFGSGGSHFSGIKNNNFQIGNNVSSGNSGSFKEISLSLGGGLGLDLSLNQSPVKNVSFASSGSPQQAPGMKNSRKPGRFQFPVIEQEKPQIHLIIEKPEVEQEQKMSEPEIVLQLPKKLSKKKFNKQFLSINTEEINEQYDRQMNPTTIDEQGEIQEIEKIRQLTMKCLVAMNKLDGIKEFSPIKQSSQIRPAPLSVREKKSFNFPIHTIIAPLMSTRNRDVQQKTRKRNFQDLIIQEQSQQSASNKKSSSVLSIEQRITPRLSPSDKNMHQNLILLYTSMIEMVFQRNINKVTTPPPKIESMNCLYILLTWTLETTIEIKEMVLIDLITITESPENLTLLASSEQVLKFILKMIQQSLRSSNTNLLSDSHQLFKKLIIQIFFKNTTSCDEKLLFIVNWSSKIIIRYVWKIILNAIQQYCSLFVGNDVIRQRNFGSLCVNTEQLLFYSKDGGEPGLFYVPQSSLPNLMKEIFSSNNNWIDQILVQQLIRIFNKYFITQTYHQRKKNIGNLQNDQKFIQSIFRKSNEYVKQTIYFLGTKGNKGFILSLVNIYTAYIEVINHNDTVPIENVEELISLMKLLFLFPEIMTPKEYQEKKNLISEILAYCFRVLVMEQREMIGKEIYNFTVKLKGIVKKQLNLIGTESGPVYVNNLIQQFLDKHFRNYSYIFQKDRYQKYSPQLKNLLSSSPTPLPLRRPFNSLKILSRLIPLDDKVKQRYQYQIYQFITNTVQQETNRQYHICLLQQVYSRKYKKEFKQIWKRLRLYNSIWAHPGFYFQNDNLFSKVSTSYERMYANKIYDVKVSGHESKIRARVLLGLRLKEPQIVEKERQKRKEGEREKVNIGFQNTYKLMGKIVDQGRLNLNHSMLQMISPWKSQDLQLKKVQLITTLTLRQGYFTITNQKLLFIYSYFEQKKTHLCMVAAKIQEDESLIQEWPLEYVRQIQKRRFINQRTALEIFLVNGKSIFVNFPNGDADEFARRLVRERKRKCPNIVYYKTLQARKIIEESQVVKRWNNYEITNFEYIMQLNSLSGRSYKDISQYPVFPWLITSFAEKLDLGSIGSYRDLKKNMGSLGSQKRIANFHEKYEGLGMDEPFHFGTHYSSPGVIFHYLVRLPPYTEGLIILQSGHFDFADRMFFSIYDSYKNCITEQSDVRELIPEFFTLPQVFLNLNHYDFGIMQNNKRVHNVELPLWAKDNPYFYVSRLRKAMESNYVNHNIHNWVDLIFGYKQKGEQARKNLNTFISITYEDSVDFAHLSLSEKLAKEAQILNYGQTPSQIFLKPHQQKSQIHYIPLILSDDIQPKVYRPPQKKNQQVKLQLNPLLFNAKSIIKLKETKDSSNSKETKLICIRKSGDVVNYKWSSQAQSQIPFQCIMEEQRKFQRINKAKYDPNEFYDLSCHPENFPIEIIKNGELIFLGGLYEGKLLALPSDDTNSEVETYKSHHDTISVLKCDINDKFLVSGDITGDVILWRVSNHGKLLLFHKYSDHSDAVTSIFICEELKVFATSSKDGSVHLYNIITGEKMRSYFHPDRKAINHVLLTTSPLAAVIMFCVEQRMILSYSINGQLLKTEKCLDVSSPCILKYQKGFEYLAYGSENGKIIVRDTPFLDNPKVFTAAKEAVVTGIAISKDFKFLICCCSDGELSVIAPHLPKGNS